MRSGSKALLTLGSLCVTPGLVKERDRLKDKKQTDFLRVKLKKKKKKKKAKSGKKGTLVTLRF